MALKKILLDTNAYSAFKINTQHIIDIIQRADLVGLNAVILGELLSGFSYGKKEQQNRQELNEFITSSRVKIYPIEATTSQYYSHIYLDLRKKGTPIPTNDMWIAATALEHGLMLCTLDKHFENIDNLLICNQLSNFLP